MTSKPEFFATKDSPFEHRFIPMNEEAQKLCNIANRSYLIAAEIKHLEMIGIEVSYQEKEDGTLSI